MSQFHNSLVKAKKLKESSMCMCLVKFRDSVQGLLSWNNIKLRFEFFFSQWLKFLPKYFKGRNAWEIMQGHEAFALYMAVPYFILNTTNSPPQTCKSSLSTELGIWALLVWLNPIHNKMSRFSIKHHLVFIGYK